MKSLKRLEGKIVTWDKRLDEELRCFLSIRAMRDFRFGAFNYNSQFPVLPNTRFSRFLVYYD